MKLNRNNVDPKIMPTKFTYDYNREITQLVNELLDQAAGAKTLLVQQKIKTALARVKSARSLLDAAEGTLNWAKGYNENSYLTNS